MSGRLNVLDRFVAIVVGLVLIALGLLALDWRYGWVLDLPTELSTGAAQDVVAAGWFPWTLAAVGVVLALLALWWLAAHARRPHESTLRLRSSSAEGRVEVDLPSVASAVADRFGSLTPTDGARGRSRTYGRDEVVEVRARLDPRADGQSVAEAARRCAEDVATALPDRDATLRVVLDGPSRRRPRSSGRTARVH